MNDWQLLSDYATRNSEEAFRTLVERYGGFVYHTALRRLGAAPAAQDVTQAVFIVLAQKAGRIPREATLAGWLFRATQFAVSNLVRAEVRRHRREEEAAMQAGSSRSEAAESVWARIAPHIDEALNTLSRSDREAILIRFFHEKSHAELARLMGTTEDAAKMRVSRAVAKVRLALAKRGLAISAGTLLGALTASSGAAAPAGLNSTVAMLALAKGSGGTSSTLALTKGIIKLMSWKKITVMAVGAVMLLAGVTVLTVVSQSPSTPKPAPVPGISESRATPKATLRYLAAMLDKGDGTNAAAAVQLGAGKYPQADAAVAQLVTGQAAFKHALIARFGAASVEQALQRWKLISVPADNLDAATEDIAGAAATVTLPGQKPLQFTRSEAGWRLVLTGGNDSQMIAQFDSIGTAMLQIATELDTGRYASSEEAFRSLQARLMKSR